LCADGRWAHHCVYLNKGDGGHTWEGSGGHVPVAQGDRAGPHVPVAQGDRAGGHVPVAHGERAGPHVPVAHGDGAAGGAERGRDAASSVWAPLPLVVPSTEKNDQQSEK